MRSDLESTPHGRRRLVYNSAMTKRPLRIDTSADAEAVQLECWRRMTPSERIRKSCALSQQVKRMAFAAIRRTHPDDSEQEVQLRFIELAYGAELAADVRRWMKEREE